MSILLLFFFFSSRRRHTRLQGDWSSDVCSSDLASRSLTACPPPNLRVSQSSISLSKAFKSTRKLASIRPSATGRVSSNAERPVKLRMQKLSSQATGQSRGPSGSMTSTRIFLANMVLGHSSLVTRPWYFFLAVGRQGQGTNDRRVCGLTPKKREPASLGLGFAKFARLRAGRQRLPVDDRLLIFD